MSDSAKKTSRVQIKGCIDSDNNVRLVFDRPVTELVLTRAQASALAELLDHTASQEAPPAAAMLLKNLDLPKGKAHL